MQVTHLQTVKILVLSSHTVGQLSQVGRQFYNTDIEVEILSKEETEKMTYVVCTVLWASAYLKLLLFNNVMYTPAHMQVTPLN